MEVVVADVEEIFITNKDIEKIHGGSSSENVYGSVKINEMNMALIIEFRELGHHSQHQL